MSSIPARLVHRPRDPRGLVIPYAQFVDSDGKPDFRVIDHAHAQRCARRRLCFMCGEPLGRHLFFIGGPRCAEHGVFYDGPMHRECAIFALQTCPHLARSKGRYADADLVADAHASATDLKVVVGAMDTAKPRWYGLMHTTAYTFGRMGDMLAFKANLPWLDVVKYRDGVPL